MNENTKEETPRVDKRAEYIEWLRDQIAEWGGGLAPCPETPQAFSRVSPAGLRSSK